MYLFRSVDLQDLPNTNDLKRRVLEHFRNPMPSANVEIEQLADLCQSNFEKDVFDRLVKLGYRVTPQVGVGRFRIDLVVEGEKDRRVAIELDGDAHHGPEQWLADWSRQRMMERVGWQFWRCWYSSFIMDPDGCMKDLVDTLDEMKIRPLGPAAGPQPYTEHRTVSTPGVKLDVGTDGEPETEAEVGDRLVIAFEDEPARHYLVTLSDAQHDLVNGIVSVTEPVGKVLLHAVSEDEVQLTWNGRQRIATVLEIQKAQVAV